MGGSLPSHVQSSSTSEGLQGPAGGSGRGYSSSVCSSLTCQCPWFPQNLLRTSCCFLAPLFPSPQLAVAFEFTGALVLGRVSTSTIAGGIASIDFFVRDPEIYAYGGAGAGMQARLMKVVPMRVCACVCVCVCVCVTMLLGAFSVSMTHAIWPAATTAAPVHSCCRHGLRFGGWLRVAGACPFLPLAHGSVSRGRDKWAQPRHRG